MADEGEAPAEGEEQPVEAQEPAGPPPNMLHVTIRAARGLPEESATVVKFRYSLLAGEEAEEAAVAAAAEKGEDAKPLGIIEGATAEFEEPPAGTEHTYNFTASHILAPTTGAARGASRAPAARALMSACSRAPSPPTNVSRARSRWCGSAQMWRCIGS
jgi:hypothetical protein